MVKIYDFNADYVLYADYKALEAEVERLRQENAELRNILDRCLFEMDRAFGRSKGGGDYTQDGQIAPDIGFLARLFREKCDENAALVTALDEATTVRIPAIGIYPPDKERDLSRLSRASLAVAEKWLAKKDAE